MPARRGAEVAPIDDGRDQERPADQRRENPDEAPPSSALRARHDDVGYRNPPRKGPEEAKSVDHAVDARPPQGESTK